MCSPAGAPPGRVCAINVAIIKNRQRLVTFDTKKIVARANDTEYGLVAYVVTENGARQRRMANALDYGMVAVNRVKITGAPIPFGGVKQSGLGREGSRHGLEAFTDLKYICLDLA